MNPLFNFINGGILLADEAIEQKAIESTPDQLINEAFAQVGLAMIHSMEDYKNKLDGQNVQKSRSSVESGSGANKSNRAK